MEQFNYTPVLTGDSLCLRALQEHDREALFVVSSDPLLWEQHPQKDRCQRPVFDSWFDQALTKQALVIIDAQQDKVIGSSRYYEVDEVNSSVAIGYTFLARDYWGGVTNQELKRLMLAHAFQSFDMVWFHIAEINLRSRKAAEKIGAVLSHTGLREGIPYCWYQLDQ